LEVPKSVVEKWKAALLEAHGPTCKLTNVKKVGGNKPNVWTIGGWHVYRRQRLWAVWYVSAHAMTMALVLPHTAITRMQASDSMTPMSPSLSAKPRPCVPLMRAVAIRNSAGRNLPVHWLCATQHRRTASRVAISTISTISI